MKNALALAVLLAGAGAIGRTAPADTVVASLSELFKPGVVFQDRNGDGAIDFTDARIVLPAQPSSADLAAASDIAARLGYETSAMNLPVPVARGFSRPTAPRFSSAPGRSPVRAPRSMRSAAPV